jgi:acyl carrier protein
MLELEDDTSLIQSGLLDSSALFNLALWIENHTNLPIDPASFDLPREWDTIDGILYFIGEKIKNLKPE